MATTYYSKKSEMSSTTETKTAVNKSLAEEKAEALELMLKMTTEHMTVVENELRTEREKLQVAAKQINDSLLFASILQNAIMPTEEELARHFSQYLLHYRQKDVIGGDLLWIRERDGQISIACMDCTGHGVPGAMLSMAAHFSLNDVFDKQAYTDPADLLEDFNTQFYRHFHCNKDSSNSINHGLDIGLAIVDADRKELKYAGTHQSLICTSGKDLTVFRGFPGYIGNENLHVEKTHTIQIDRGHKYFMFTDGISDQFGGPKNKKFLTKRLRDVLKRTHLLEMPAQSSEIVKTLKDWQGDEEQTDDMLLVGFTI